MNSLEMFRLMTQASNTIERNLESLARIVEGADQKNSMYNNLVIDLKKLFPQDTDHEELVRALVTEKCRVEYIKMMNASKPKSYMGRD